MLLTSDLIRGHTETIILARLFKKDSYGYEINKAVAENSGDAYELKEATLYSAFRRLEEGGFISSYWGDETTGARRRYYKILPRGIILYKKNRDEWEGMKELIDKLIETEDKAQ